jgi:hypothetical protein
MAIPADLQGRISAARIDRAKRQDQINSYFDFADPAQPRVGVTEPTVDNALGVGELYDSTLMEVHEDFASDVIDRVMPRGRDWVEYQPDEALDESLAKQLAPEFQRRRTVIFSEIRKSNFYSEAAGEWAGHLAHGTGAMTINDFGAGQPLSFEAITPAQLLIERGPGGSLSLRGREFKWPIEDAIAYWPHYNWKAKHRNLAKSKETKRQRVMIVEAATLIPDPGMERWQWRVCVDDELVLDVEISGRGSCPILVTRWRTFSTSAWGVGPGLKCLPDAMTLNQERKLILKNLGKIVDPPIAYDDDGVLNPEGGVGPGDWIPRMPGSKVEQLKQEGNIEAAYYEQGFAQDAIRRSLYQYGPRQRGKTPPTFGQWQDEKNEEGRRLELPTGKVYDEGVLAVLLRVEYLMTKRGALDPTVTAHGDKVIRYVPQSPLSRQQAGEDVAQANQVLTMFRGAMDPQTFAATVDLQATAANVVDKLNDKIIVIRDPDQAQQLLQQVIGQAPQGQGAQPGAAAAGAPAAG